MAEVTVLQVPAFSTLCNEAFRLRRAVFIGEQKVPEAEEFDADDFTAFHVVAILAGEVCGTLRIITMDDHVKIGRVVVRQSWRGRGVASAMLRFALDRYYLIRDGRFYLTAQSDKIALYSAFGFAAFGDEFLDAGMPHLAMKTYERLSGSF